MVSGPRIYLALVWLYLAGIVVQTFLAGAALFSPGRDFELHRSLGYLLHLYPIVLIIAAVAGRLGRDLITWTLALLVVQGIQPLLPGLRTDYPLVAAFHPVLVLGIFYLGITLGLKAWRLVNSTQPTSAQGA